MIKRLLALVLLLPSLVWADYSATVRSKNPIVYWRFGEASGTVATDSSGNGNTGAYASLTTLGQTGAISGDANTAVLLSGVSTGTGFISISGTPSPTSLGPPASVVEWIKPTSSCSGSVECPFYSSRQDCGTGSGANFAVFGLNTFIRQIGNGAGTWCTLASVSQTFSAGVYAMVSIVVNATTAPTYFNGALIDTASWSSCTPVLYNSTLPFRVGEQTCSGNHMAGTVDEFALFNTALTGADMTQLFNCGSAGTGCAGGSNSGGMPFPLRFFQQAVPTRPNLYDIAWKPFSMPVLPLDEPSFMIDKLNKQAHKNPGQYPEY